MRKECEQALKLYSTGCQGKILDTRFVFCYTILRNENA